MNKIIKVFAMVGSIFVGACDNNVNKIASNGDTVVIDFAGFLNDVQFEGGTASGYSLKLGSNTFVPGFEEQLVGAKVGETRDVKITFPQQYVPSLAGKEVIFKVTVKDIIK